MFLPLTWSYIFFVSAMRELKKSMLVKQTMFKRSPRNAYIPWEVLFFHSLWCWYKATASFFKAWMSIYVILFYGQTFPNFFLLFPTLLSCPVVETSPFPTQWNHMHSYILKRKGEHIIWNCVGSSLYVRLGVGTYTMYVGAF